MGWLDSTRGRERSSGLGAARRVVRRSARERMEVMRMGYIAGL